MSLPPGKRFHLQATARLGSARPPFCRTDGGRKRRRRETTVAWQQEAESYQIVIKQVVKCDRDDKQPRRPPAPLNKGGLVSNSFCVVTSA